MFELVLHFAIGTVLFVATLITLAFAGLLACLVKSHYDDYKVWRQEKQR